MGDVPLWYLPSPSSSASERRRNRPCAGRPSLPTLLLLPASPRNRWLKLFSTTFPCWLLSPPISLGVIPGGASRHQQPGCPSHCFRPSAWFCLTKLPWTPHPMSCWARDKHTDFCCEHFPPCPSSFLLLGFAAELDGAILGLAFFTLECHHPGGMMVPRKAEEQIQCLLLPQTRRQPGGLGTTIFLENTGCIKAKAMGGGSHLIFFWGKVCACQFPGKTPRVAAAHPPSHP